MPVLTIQNYVRVQSLEEAYTLNQNKRNRILGGMLWLKMSNITVSTAIDLGDLGLDRIEETEESFSIGAMVTLRQLEKHEGLNAYTGGAAAQAVESIVGVQLRNMATVCGSVFGRFGFSDVLTLLMAMDAYVELYKGGIVSVADFAAMPYDRDILVRIIIRKRPGRFAYRSVRNSRTDYPVLACAASCLDGEYRVAIGARPARAIVLTDEKELLKDGINESSARAFAEYAAQTVPTGGNIRGSADYRTHLIRVLTQRALLEVGGGNHGD